VLALFFSSPEVLSVIPIGILGSLLVFVGFELIRHSIKTDSYLVTGLIGILALSCSMTVAFIAGMAVAGLIDLIKKQPS
jgi:MFS superfamily sulfate permease-like transporter